MKKLTHAGYNILVLFLYLLITISALGQDEKSINKYLPYIDMGYTVYKNLNIDARLSWDIESNNFIHLIGVEARNNKFGVMINGATDYTKAVINDYEIDNYSIGITYGVMLKYCAIKETDTHWSGLFVNAKMTHILSFYPEIILGYSNGLRKGIFVNARINAGTFPHMILYLQFALIKPGLINLDGRILSGDSGLNFGIKTSPIIVLNAVALPFFIIGSLIGR